MLLLLCKGGALSYAVAEAGVALRLFQVQAWRGDKDVQGVLWCERKEASRS
jgi:hypothetical protein